MMSTSTYVTTRLRVFMLLNKNVFTLLYTVVPPQAFAHKCAHLKNISTCVPCEFVHHHISQTRIQDNA